jgi:hypothetical protein
MYICMYNVCMYVCVCVCMYMTVCCVSECVYDGGGTCAVGGVRDLFGALMRADYDTMRALLLSSVPGVDLAQEQEEVPFLQVRL